MKERKKMRVEGKGQRRPTPPLLLLSFFRPPETSASSSSPPRRSSSGIPSSLLFRFWRTQKAQESHDFLQSGNHVESPTPRLSDYTSSSQALSSSLAFLQPPSYSFPTKLASTELAFEQRSCHIDFFPFIRITEFIEKARIAGTTTLRILQEPLPIVLTRKFRFPACIAAG
ncbi:hypothetical protein JCGZ_20031 [Jatropha curcas]|uniref:Uncharacterized protein n=1 Tax=Jatropha curcas TaxID=180498 RepID=A0A067JXL9_JATCU|nr:hypothetical protein JCGZ_20031 [Jatropha curcas]